MIEKLTRIFPSRSINPNAQSDPTANGGLPAYSGNRPTGSSAIPIQLTSISDSDLTTPAPAYEQQNDSHSSLSSSAEPINYNENDSKRLDYDHPPDSEPTSPPAYDRLNVPYHPPAPLSDEPINDNDDYTKRPDYDHPPDSEPPKMSDDISTSDEEVSGRLPPPYSPENGLHIKAITLSDYKEYA